MYEFFLNNIEFMLFILFLVVFLFLKREKLEVQGKFPFFYILMYKMKFGISLMKTISQKFPRLTLSFAYLSFFIGFVGVFLVLIFFIWQIFFIYNSNIEVGGAFVLPVKTESGLSGNVPIFYVPFFEWIVALLILAIVHEFAHGVVSKLFKVKIKSSGFAFLGILLPILPAAFVEPDEKHIKKSTFFQKISIYGAGSTSNFIFGGIFLALSLLLALVISNISYTSNFEFNEVLNKSDLKNYDLKNGSILRVNEETDKSKFLEIFSSLEKNQSIILKINNSNDILDYEIKPYFEKDLNKYMIGISQIDITNTPIEGYELSYSILNTIFGFLFWIWFLNIMIGFANLLPLGITDGGLIFKEICLKYFSEKVALMINFYITILVLIIFVFTLYPSLLFLIF